MKGRGGNSQKFNGVSTNLSYANFDRAKLFKAHMNSAQLQGANLFEANLTLSDITSATFGKMAEQELKYFFEKTSQLIKNQGRLKVFQDRLSEAIRITATLAEAKGQNIWIKEPDEIVQKAFNESKGRLEFAKSESDYQNGLAVFLIELSCQNKWVASGIIRNRVKYNPLETSLALCLLSLKDKTDRSGRAVCPGLSEISNNEIGRLKRMASKPKPENNIQSTFKCKDSKV